MYTLSGYFLYSTSGPSLTVSPLLPFSPPGPPTSTVSPCVWQNSYKQTTQNDSSCRLFLSGVTYTITANQHCVYSYIPRYWKGSFKTANNPHQGFFFPLPFLCCLNVILTNTKMYIKKESKREQLFNTTVKWTHLLSFVTLQPNVTLRKKR